MSAKNRSLLNLSTSRKIRIIVFQKREKGKKERSTVRNLRLLTKLASYKEIKELELVSQTRSRIIRKNKDMLAPTKELDPSFMHSWNAVVVLDYGSFPLRTVNINSSYSAAVPIIQFWPRGRRWIIADNSQLVVRCMTPHFSRLSKPFDPSDLLLSNNKNMQLQGSHWCSALSLSLASFFQ